MLTSVTFAVQCDRATKQHSEPMTALHQVRVSNIFEVSKALIIEVGYGGVYIHD
jgi:hypothetical protein